MGGRVADLAKEAHPLVKYPFHVSPAQIRLGPGNRSSRFKEGSDRASGAIAELLQDTD